MINSISENNDFNHNIPPNTTIMYLAPVSTNEIIKQSNSLKNRKMEVLLATILIKLCKIYN